MSKYVRKADRMQQVARWLSVSFPVPWKVTTNIVDALCLGPDRNGIVIKNASLGASLVYTEEDAEIQLLRSMAFQFMLDVLLHEWAHLRRQIGHVGHGGCGEKNCVEYHDDEFFLEYGRISRRYDNGGRKLSKSY